MSIDDKVSAYIEKHVPWRDELKSLRALFQESELEEDVKWGAPAYTLNGKIVAGLAAYKNHIGIWFHQGVFLKDVQKKFWDDETRTAEALRQWRFKKGDPIEGELVQLYIQEAIENSLAGKETKSQRTQIKEIVVPEELEEAFRQNDALRNSFDQLSPGKRKEYAGYISETKRGATKTSRLEKITPLIIAGQGLHDKYKNC